MLHPDRKRYRSLSILFASLLLLFAGCAREQDGARPLARVGEAVLTRADLAEVQDSLGGHPINEDEYVRRWVTSEMLYQEALRRGIGNTETFRQRIEDIRKRLVVDALLEEVLFVDDSSIVSEDDIVALYTSSSAEFLLKEDVASVGYARFSDREAANAFRLRLLQGSSWVDAVTATERDSTSRTKLTRVVTRQYVTRTTLYPEELWKLARALTKDDVSFVLRVDSGYYVLVSHGLKQQGEMPELEFVRNEIRDRILIEQRRLRYQALLAELRERFSVEVAIDDETTRTGEINPR